MTREEFIVKRSAARLQGRRLLVWFIAMISISCCFATLNLIGFLCYLPFEGFLPDDRKHILFREVLLLILVISVAAGILLADWIWSRRSGFICRSCNKRYDTKVEQTGCCVHCGVRVFTHDASNEDSSIKHLPQ
jgi:hypothetical protein